MSSYDTDSGAHFYRTDFQVHTPRDSNWDGSRAVSQSERTEYARQFVSACRQKNLRAVAIADHHDFVFFPYIRRAAEQEQDQSGVAFPERDCLVVFPGLELTLAVPCQALLILDADFPTERLDSVLEALAIQAADETLAKLPPVVRIDHIQTFEDLYATLDTRAWLRGKYIVLPNVTEGGYATLMRSGMHAKYKTMPCVGGYLDGSVDDKAKAKSKNSRIFAGLDANWGHKRIALFQTSDSRRGDFSTLGKYSSWVKWAQPSAEAIRQACLAQESRVSQAEPSLPSVYISSVHVSNSKFLGPLDLAMNRQYNAVIGGRGTGKSTILDYVRWCLGDEPEGQPSDGEPASDTRRRRLIESTLTSMRADVEVEVLINGIRHVVRRSSITGEIRLKVGDGELTKVSEASIQSLLPIQAYSQKQLSSVSVRMEELTRFVQSGIREHLEAKDSQIRDAANRLRQNYASLLRSRSIEKAVERADLTERSLLDQAAHLRASLTGLSDDDRLVLEERTSVDRWREVAREWELTTLHVQEVGAGTLAEIDRAAARFAPALADSPVSLTTELGSAHREVSEAVRVFASSVGDALSKLGEDLSDAGSVGVALDRVWQTFRTLDESYGEVKARSSTHSQQLQELADIERKRTQIASELAILRKDLAGSRRSVWRSREAA